MVETENARRLGEKSLEERLQARPSVAQRDVLIGVSPTDLQRLAVELPPELIKLEKPR